MEEHRRKNVHILKTKTGLTQEISPGSSYVVCDDLSIAHNSKLRLNKERVFKPKKPVRKLTNHSVRAPVHSRIGDRKNSDSTGSEESSILHCKKFERPSTFVIKSNVPKKRGFVKMSHDRNHDYIITNSSEVELNDDDQPYVSNRNNFPVCNVDNVVNNSDSRNQVSHPDNHDDAQRPTDEIVHNKSNANDLNDIISVCNTDQIYFRTVPKIYASDPINRCGVQRPDEESGCSQGFYDVENNYPERLHSHQDFPSIMTKYDNMLEIETPSRPTVPDCSGLELFEHISETAYNIPGNSQNPSLSLPDTVPKELTILPKKPPTPRVKYLGGFGPEVNRDNLAVETNPGLLNEGTKCHKALKDAPLEEAIRKDGKWNYDHKGNYIEEIQRKVSMDIYSKIIDQTRDPRILIKCIKAIAEISQIIPKPGAGKVSVADKMYIYKSLRDVLEFLHKNYSAQKQYKHLTIKNLNLPEYYYSDTAHDTEEEFVKATAIKLLSFLQSDEDIENLDKINLKFNESLGRISKGSRWVYELQENDLTVDPASVLSSSEPDELHGIIEPDFDIIFDDT